MVVLLEAQRQQEEAEKEQNMPSTHNSAHQPGGGSFSGETVTYTNEGLKGD